MNMHFIKKLTVGALALLLCAGMLAGCAAASSSSGAAASSSEAATSVAPVGDSTSASQQEDILAENEVYRGIITAVGDTSITVQQVHGYNYGQDEIVFNLSDATVLETSDLQLAEGSFVEVYYNGALTRSLPAQGSAARVVLVSTAGQGVVVNGEVLGVTELENGGYTIMLNRFVEEETAASGVEQAADAQASAVSEEPATVQGADYVIITLASADMLEGITLERLVEGAQISVVTRGIAALSNPPQMPALAVLPYQP